MVAVTLVAAFFWHLAWWPFVCDDAYISFRYAENLSRAGLLVYNTHPVEYVEGYTNFSWVVLLAGLDRLGVAPPRAAVVGCAAASLACLVLVVELLGALREAFPMPSVTTEAQGDAEVASRWLSPWVLLPAALLVASPEFVVWGSGGLETSMACALVLGAMLTWTRGRPVAAAALAALAGLTRFDALLPIAAFGLGWLVPAALRHRERNGRIDLADVPWRRIAVAAVVFVAPLAAHFAFRHAYYGAWWPNTWAIKHHGRLLRDTNGVAYVSAWASWLHLVWVAPMLALVRLRHMPLVLPVAVVVAYAWWVGGDFMAYGRFMLPATTSLAALVSWLAMDGDDLLARRGWPGRAWPVLRAVLVLLALGLASQAPSRVALDRAKPWIDGRWEGVMGMDRFARERVAAGSWMRDHLPPDTLVTVGAAGAMPYAAGVQIIDAYGLVDPELASTVEPLVGDRARPGHQIQAPRSYIQARDPDLLCHLGWVGPGVPPARAARRRGGGAYRWACIPVGAVDDPYSPDGRREVGNYCCLQPLDRTELGE